MRFAFIATEKACYPVALMCRVLKVSRARILRLAAAARRRIPIRIKGWGLQWRRFIARVAAAMAAPGSMPNCASAASAPGASGWRG